MQEALEHPIGTPRLSEMAVGKKNIVVISSDHTRPVPSHIIMPLLLAEIRKGNPDADITILISTGLHRPTTHENWWISLDRKLWKKKRLSYMTVMTKTIWFMWENCLQEET